MLKIIHQNILDQPTIFHQCNCKSTESKGVARAIFDKYPDANTYIGEYERIPGNIHIIDYSGSKKIINAYGQIYPGKPQHGIDSPQERLRYFRQCLDLVLAYNIKRIAVPWKIGCNLGGGIWEHYEESLIQYSDRLDIDVCYWRKI